jgi:hypothetical protein
MSWIKVTDGEPAPNRTYIVTVESKNTGKFTTAALYNTWLEWEMLHEASEYKRDDCLFKDFGMEVTHFMPLPDPAE